MNHPQISRYCARLIKPGADCIEDNAVVESFFQLLKRERVKRKIYKTREDARRDIFDYIELFFNPKRKHGYNGNLSPAEFEKRYFVKLGSV